MENAGNRIDYFERMLADNPDNPTGLLALANEYGKAERPEEEAAVLQRYVAKHDDEGTTRQHIGELQFSTSLSGGAERLELARA